MGEGVWVNVARPASCKVEISIPQAIPTLSLT